MSNKYKDIKSDLERLNNKARRAMFKGDFYQAGYRGLIISIYTTPDQHAEYNQGANDRKRERDDEC